MNKSFILLDKTNNVQKIANTIIKFNNEEKDYLIYSIDENEQNKQIFVSKLIINSEGKNFIDNITPEEKNKLSNIVYNIVILTPSDAKKGGNPDELIKDLTEKLEIKFSTDIPELSEQEYYSNCSIAITGKEFVDEAVKFYSENIKNESVALNESSATPTWTIPSEESIAPVANAEVPAPAEPEQVQVPEIVPIPQEQPVVTPSVVEVAPIPTPAVETPVVPNPEPVVNNLNPQTEKTETVAVVSDPSLGLTTATDTTNTNINLQPNVGKRNAGFAINKYIIIGSICILAAIAVVAVAYVLIQKKINGA